MTTNFEEEIVVQPMERDPFPQPQTIPAGWDVSEFYTRLEAAGAADDLTETESH
jgi:hypothetical protein